MTFRNYFIVIVCGLLLAISRVPAEVQAQGQTVLTVALASYQAELLGMNFFDQFEAEHPGVQVRTVDPGQASLIPSVLDDVERHLNTFEQYAQTADVLPLTQYQISAEAVRAGYLLDMMPLVSADATLNSADFYPVAWQSYQWDGGMWALPVSMNVNGYIYNPMIFDSLGLPYPNADWTLTDIANASRALAMRDANNTIVTSGFGAYEIGGLFQSLLGQSMVDPATFPAMPNLNNPNLANLVNEWTLLEAEGIVSRTGFNPVDLPFALSGLALIQQNTALQFAPLAGNQSLVGVDGLMISAGTQYPELAYELAKYMTRHVEVTQMFFDDVPARISLTSTLDPVIQQAIMTSLPFAERRFNDYVNMAIDQVVNSGLDAVSALQVAQTQAQNNLQVADARRASLNMVVDSASQVGQGEVELTFGVHSTILPMPNEAVWRELADDFADLDPQVGYINIEPIMGTPSNTAQTNDCFYYGGNVNDQLSLSDVLILDPLLSADPNFNPNDYLTGVLDQLRRDNQVLGLPMGVQPTVLWYDTTVLEQMGINPSGGRWSINQFNDALQALPNPVFTSTNASNTYLLMLMASYGALPVDFRSTLPVINFTDSTSVDVMRQVLDLARNGHISYQPLIVSGMGSGGLQDLNATPIHTDTLGTMSVRIAMRNGGLFGQDAPMTDNYALVNFPQGVYAPISYAIPTAYISANTAYIDACYRWLSYLADYPDRFNLMPATYSLLNDSIYTATQTPEFMAFYISFAELLQDPNAVVIPNTFQWGIGSPVPMFWLNRAFDAYVLNGADLVTELAQAEQYTRDYQACIANIPPFNPAVDDVQSYQQPFLNCAMQVDPTAIQ